AATPTNQPSNLSNGFRTVQATVISGSPKRLPSSIPASAPAGIPDHQRPRLASAADVASSIPVRPANFSGNQLATFHTDNPVGTDNSVTFDEITESPEVAAISEVDWSVRSIANPTPITATGIKTNPESPSVNLPMELASPPDQLGEVISPADADSLAATPSATTTIVPPCSFRAEPKCYRNTLAGFHPGGPTGKEQPGHQRSGSASRLFNSLGDNGKRLDNISIV
ncbi:hypothetical protein OAG51_03910, partial [Pirellulaceae bacterium]|nr:hypothetical protein [Pirellulaceae bacterium]